MRSVMQGAIDTTMLGENVTSQLEGSVILSTIPLMFSVFIMFHGVVLIFSGIRNLGRSFEDYSDHRDYSSSSDDDDETDDYDICVECEEEAGNTYNNEFYCHGCFEKIEERLMSEETDSEVSEKPTPKKKVVKTSQGKEVTKSRSQEL